MKFKPGQVIRRRSWPDNEVLVIKEVHGSMGLSGQLFRDERPVGSHQAYYSFRPGNVDPDKWGFVIVEDAIVLQSDGAPL